jgi:hypothetical protein
VRPLEERLTELKRPSAAVVDRVNPALLTRACVAVAEWLDRAGAVDRAQALEALQIAIRATPTRFPGVLPTDVPRYCSENEHANALCPVNDGVLMSDLSAGQ